ncbi:hypothetical protein VC83_08666 [Pseudogymnoascus destructans]|uniref:Uncharacterized protein n=2 Tax=Pseudogymnoascus destructans TaxID=655981 RepID=L8FND0_PSED2|nr:uncharacterized protein VC83_08666 [Pseudogymnoascus destructans]ELR02044.1 hypothetical protein GMDG_05206 [Pseudogymnoascus destructans 20631-21]OAF54905.1 hypothetical protein VC83_08666 [Pseudogymnoascus destructans]
MAKHSWKEHFSRQEETAALQPCTDDEQLPRYSESKNQENVYGTMGQSPSNVEKSKVNQRTEAEKWEVDIVEKWNSETEAEKEKRRRLYSGLQNRLNTASNESLEKLLKSDLIELLDTVREDALTPRGPNLAEELDIARGKSFTTPSIKAQNMPFEKLSKLGLMELLRVARATPYYRIPKSVFMKVPNSDLVNLLREARSEDLKKYRVADYKDRVSRHVEKEKSDKVEGQVKAMKTDFVEGRCVGSGNVTPESDIATGSCTDSSSTADSTTQVDNKNEPLRQATIQARLETDTAIEKTRDLHHLLIRLETDMEQQKKTFGIQDFDNVRVKAVEVGRDLDDSILRVREMISLL